MMNRPLTTLPISPRLVKNNSTILSGRDFCHFADILKLFITKHSILLDQRAECVLVLAQLISQNAPVAKQTKLCLEGQGQDERVVVVVML